MKECNFVMVLFDIGNIVMQRFFYFILVLLPFYSVATPLEIAKDAAFRGDYAQALAVYQPLAEQGDAKAQFNLALMYREGAGVEKNRDQAMLWLDKAATQGLAEAQFILGEMMIYGKDGFTRYEVASKLSHRSSATVERGIALIMQADEQGLVQAQEFLEYLRQHGIIPINKQDIREKVAK